MADKTRTYVYVGLGVVVLAAVVYLMQPADAGSKTSAKVAKRATTNSRTVDAFTQEDRTAKFARLNEPVRNAFKPLVVGRNGRAGVSGETGPTNAVPSEFAGGESGWVYTGTAIIDDVPTALLENPGSGEGVFLKQGERWKQCRVQRIGPDTVTLTGANGGVRTLQLYFEPAVQDLPPGQPGGNQPMQPPMLGPMGGPPGMNFGPMG